MTNSKPSVYAAGPISGLTYGASKGWRNLAWGMLAPDIDLFCPMRAQEHLVNHGVLNGSYDGHVLTTARAIMTRDHWDCFKCDLIIANFLGAERVSIGTCMEVAWAHSYRKPLIVVMESSGNPHEHPMIAEATSYRVDNIEEAVDIARAVLLA
jgi:nucleoside 2-deoxyribosyltransferase